MKRKDRSSTSAKEERKSKKTKKVSEVEEFQQSSKLDFSSPEKLLSSLVAPTTSEAFFSDYWEKKPLLIQRDDTSFYGPLFTKEDLEDILKREELRFAEDVNVVRYEDGDKLYLNGEPEERATWSQVNKDIKEKNATVQFHQPQRFKDILWKMNANLETLFGCLVGANVYITPPGSQGLAPHYDDVEIFILQVEGRKKWKLYKPPIELPQEYSPDLDQDSIGEPTHEFELQPGDMVYFPRGTVHQAVTPEGDSHSTHITISTYQQNAWGNLLSHIVTDAVENAIKSDFEFRGGVPIKYHNYMGIGKQKDETLKASQDDFVNKIKQLISKLCDHLDVHKSVDKIAADFMANRLPPIEQKEDAMKEENGDTDKAPTEDSEVKFRYPEHVRISVGTMPEMIPIGIVDDDEDDEGSSSDDEKSEEADSEDESMESDEEEKPKAKKKTKSKQKSVKKSKGEKSKKKKKQEESDEEDEEDEEEDDESSDEKSKAKKKKKSSKIKTKKGKAKKGKNEESDEDEEMESEEEKPKKKTKGKQDAEAKKKKGKKGKKSESEDDDDDESFELGDDDTEDSDDEDESDEESEGPWVFVHHSLNNDPTLHMIQTQQPSIVKFKLLFKDAIIHLYSKRLEYTAVKDLPLETEDAKYLVTSLWSEGLLDIKD